MPQAQGRKTAPPQSPARTLAGAIRGVRRYEKSNTEARRHREDNEGHIKTWFASFCFPFRRDLFVPREELRAQHRVRRGLTEVTEKTKGRALLRGSFLCSLCEVSVTSVLRSLIAASGCAVSL